MAVDVTLTTITTGYNLTKLNANFVAIANALADAVSRSATSPNSMSSPLDMNSQQVINLIDPVSDGDAVRKGYGDANYGGAAAAAAVVSAAAALVSENNAATSETNAATSETNAATSETNAATSATAAEVSNVAAGVSETNAATSETNAATSATASEVSNVAAAVEAAAAVVSAAAALVSEGLASTSETNAATSETNAATSATASEVSNVAAAVEAAAAVVSAAAAVVSDAAALASLTAMNALFPLNAVDIGLADAGAFYDESDVELALRDIADGTGVAINLSNYKITATGASTARTTAAKALDIFNVMDFGAVLDGATDDTIAFQAAIDAASSGGLIFIPPGTLLTQPVFITVNSISIQGASRGSTTIKLKASASNQWGTVSFGIESDHSTQVQTDDCSIKHLTIDGNKANQRQGTVAGTDGVNDGIRADKVVRFTIEDVLVKDCDGYGIGLVGTNVTVRSDFRLKDVEISGCDYDGLDIKGGDTNQPFRIWLDSVYSHDHVDGAITSRDAVGLDLRGQYIHINDCLAVANKDGGIRLRGGTGGAFDGTVVNCTALDNTGIGFTIQGPAGNQGYRFTNCKSIGNSNTGFRIEVAGRVELSNCLSDDNAGGILIDQEIADVTVIGGLYTGNDVDGIYIITQSTINICGGAIFELNGRNGINFKGDRMLVDGAIVRNNGKTETGRGIILNASGDMEYWAIKNCQIYDNQGTPTQEYAIRFDSAPPAGLLIDNDLDNNDVGAVSGTIPAGTIRQNNKGYKTFTVLDGAAFLIDSTGEKSTVFTHGLDITPKIYDCSINVARVTDVNDWEYKYVRLVGTSSTVVSTEVEVVEASATGSSQAKLVMTIDSRIA